MSHLSVKLIIFIFSFIFVFDSSVGVWVHQLWAVSGGAPAPVWAEVFWCPGCSKWCWGKTSRSFLLLCSLSFSSCPSSVHWLVWCVTQYESVHYKLLWFENQNVLLSLAQFFNLARTLHEHMDNLESMLWITSIYFGTAS